MEIPRIQLWFYCMQCSSIQSNWIIKKTNFIQSNSILFHRMEFMSLLYNEIPFNPLFNGISFHPIKFYFITYHRNPVIQWDSILNIIQFHSIPLVYFIIFKERIPHNPINLHVIEWNFFQSNSMGFHLT